MIYSHFSIAMTLLGDERASLRAFHAFICFVCDGLSLFSLPVGVSDSLRGDGGTPYTFLFNFLVCIKASRKSRK